MYFFICMYKMYIFFKVHITNDNESGTVCSSAGDPHVATFDRQCPTNDVFGWYVS